MNYKTVKDFAFSEFTEKKSRFIGYVKPVSNEQEALSFLNTIRQKHPDATHNVYAYIIKENNITRFSDDGEPSKTAGAPVLEYLMNEGLTDLIVVVTRYFGGTLLGTGGLVKAYQRAAKECVLKADIVIMSKCIEFLLTVPYHIWGKIENELKNYNCIINNIEFLEDVSINALCKKKDFNSFNQQIQNISNGMINCLKVKETFYGFKV